MKVDPRFEIQTSLPLKFTCGLAATAGGEAFDFRDFRFRDTIHTLNSRADCGVNRRQAFRLLFTNYVEGKLCYLCDSDESLPRVTSRVTSHDGRVRVESRVISRHDSSRVTSHKKRDSSHDSSRVTSLQLCKSEGRPPKSRTSVKMQGH